VLPDRQLMGRIADPSAMTRTGPPFRLYGFTRKVEDGGSRSS
jgi:hypothetical protein